VSLGLSEASVRHILHKDLHFYPYKIQVTHALRERDYWDESQIFKIHAEQRQNCHRFCKTLSQQKHVALQTMAPLQIKCFKPGSKMAIAASAPVLPNQKKPCCKITQFTDAPVHEMQDGMNVLV